MPSSFEKQKLLADTLRDQDHEQFRRDLLRHTQQEFRRHHRAKHARALPWLALAATLLLGIYLGHSFAPRSIHSGIASASPIDIPAPTELAGMNRSGTPVKTNAGTERTIKTAPAVQIVETIPLPDTAVVRSVAQKNITITTDPRGLTQHLLVRTTEKTQTLTDDQLLALFPDRTTGLIHLSDQKLLVLGPPRP